MHRKNTSLDSLTLIWRWLRSSRSVVAWSVLIAVLLVGVSQWVEFHRAVPVLSERPYRDLSKPTLAHVYDYAFPFLRLMAMLGSVVYSLCLITSFPHVRRMIKPTAIVCVMLAAWALVDEIYSYWELGFTRSLGEPSLPFFHIVKVIIMIIAILSPPFVLAWYARQKILDRYVLKNFLQPLVFCFAAFMSLFVLMDLIDNMRDFQDSKIPLGTVLQFYFNLLPYIYVLILPASLLLAVLYALTRMSRSNEVVSMLTSGMSLGQVLRPVFIISAYATGLALIGNYDWAPRAESRRNAIVQISGEDKKLTSIVQASVMYFNPETRRIWYIGAMPFDPQNERVVQIEVRQLDKKGRLVSGWFGTSGRWLPDTAEWVFMNGVQFNYRNNVANNLVAFENVGNSTRMVIQGWPETPWSIISGALLPDNLGVPDLVSFLDANDTASDERRDAFRTQLAHRFALPVQSLVLVFMAAPLGISFSRRGALGGIAGSVFIFFGLLFLNNLFLNLGKGGHMHPLLAVWMPHLIIGGIAWWLYDMRANNRDFPTLSPRKWAQAGWKAWNNRRHAVSPARS